MQAGNRNPERNDAPPGTFAAFADDVILNGVQASRSRAGSGSRQAYRPCNAANGVSKGDYIRVYP